MATSLSDMLSAMQNGVIALTRLNTTIASIFPQVTASSTTVAVAGTITFSSSQAVGFILVELSSGATVKIPYYSQ